MQTAPRGTSVTRFRLIDRACEPCACGGYLVADRTDERAVRVTVEEHQRSLRHAIWRREQGL